MYRFGIPLFYSVTEKDMMNSMLESLGMAPLGVNDITVRMLRQLAGNSC
jgi:hypothetical protein